MKVKLKSLLDYTDRVQRLTEDQTMMFASAFMSESYNHEFPEEGKGHSFYKIIQGRLDIDDIKVSPWTVLFLACMCDRPGLAVMYAYMCLELYRKYKEEIKMTHITNEFPFGFPTEDAMKDCWDSQKGFNNDIDCDNILDKPETWMVEED
jgi:hypothetical protein